MPPASRTVSPKSADPPAPDLRQRILDTSERLLEESGVTALSMREVARRAGVTHQAPYHHFTDRESILAELVAQGFEQLARRLARANNRAATAGKRAALIDSGLAYTGFALEHPGVFRIMFRPEVCDPTRFPAAMAASDRAHAELDRLVRLMHDGQHTQALASTYWAQVHGLACLVLDGPLGLQLPSLRERRAHLRASLACFADAMLGSSGDAMSSKVQEPP
ncbi:MAG: TetR/AcrR family transcriptional regulator [Burkholderiaceae bacterium]|nr:TetR/AcrR family transcriptional regulator [Burkholderiaceae bacterium]MBP8306347.1 TetR/AcrR family transcriptional regulator [Burkholderiaceae bacterium]